MAETSADVLVIGAGTAGIPAAVFAARKGARVILLEAQDKVGGTLYVSSGHMSAAASKLQKSKGIADSAEDHFEDVMRISRRTAHPGLLRVATQNAADTIDWLMDNDFEMGPECPVIAYSHEPYKVARTYWGRDKGLSILKVLKAVLDKALQDGIVDLRLRTRVTGLERDEKSGLWKVAVDGPQGADALSARNVVLATGGYAGNPTLFPRVTNGYPLLSPAPASADGSGLEIALGLGGRIQNDGIYLPTVGGVPEESGGHYVNWDRKTNLTPQHRKPWEIYVNLQGKRFVAEDDPSPDSRERALKQQSGLAFWVVYDQAIWDEAPPLFVNRNREEILGCFGRHTAYKRADSLVALAAACGFDPQIFANTVAEYNTAQQTGRDALGRSHMPRQIAKGPFYAIRHQGVTLRCWAGLEIDESLRVVDAQGKPMGGLYAVGEIIGGAALSGDSFASGMSLTPALTFGRLLGDRIMQW